MDSDITHLEIHTGQTQKLRCQAAAPTDPTPVTGDMYIDNSAGAEAIGIYKTSSWVYISLTD